MSNEQITFTIIFVLVAAPILLGAITSRMAKRKGYHPVIWFFAGIQIFGLIVLAFLPFSEKEAADAEKVRKRVKRGNKIGWVVIVFLNILLPVTLAILAGNIHILPASWVQPYKLEKGAALKAQGKFDEAERKYKEVLRSNSRCVQAHAELADVLQAEGKYDKAVAEYQMALKLDPACIKARIGLGDTCKFQGRVDEAKAMFQSVLEISDAQKDSALTKEIQSRLQTFQK